MGRKENVMKGNGKEKEKEKGKKGRWEGKNG